MPKTGAFKQGVVYLAVGMFFLAGCDLLNSLGVGPKKQNKSPETAAPAAPAPVVAAKASPGPMPGNALVRIGGWTLTTQDFNDRIGLLKQQLPKFKENDPVSRSAVLDELIRQQLLVKDAEDSDIGNTKDIKDAVEDFRKTLIVQELASRLTKGVAATEDEARTYYEANKIKLAEPVKWGVREIVAGDEASAKNLLVQILQGGDFAELAKSQSKAADAVSGGKIKPFMAGSAPFEAMQTAIANLDTGGVSGVFKGPEGYYIVKVDAKTGGETKPFTEIKKELVYGLTLQKQQMVLLNRLKELAEKNKPEYNKDLIDQVIGKPSP